MKTLDEVIWAVENCDSAIDDCAHCAYYKEDCENLRPLRADALHYLKEYRKLDSLDAVAFPEDDNPPLTWDELKQMEGKPVWVEWCSVERKAWGLNDGTYVDAFGNDCITIKVLHDLWHFPKKGMGKDWQAFRKERK